MIQHPPVIMLLAKAFHTDPRPRQEAKSLADAGYSVFVLAWDRERQFPSNENVDGVMVRSIEYLDLGRFSRRRLAMGAIILQVLLVLETLRLVGRLRARPIVHAHDFNTLLPAYLLRRLGISVGLVYDSHELSYAAYGEFFNPVMERIVHIIEKQCVTYSDAILTVSESVAGYLGRLNPRIEIVYNCPRVADIPKLSKIQARTRLGLPLDAFIVSWVGSIRYDCRLDLLLNVASELKNENVQFAIVGGGPQAPEFWQQAKERADLRLTLTPQVGRDRALLYVLASDITWAVYRSFAQSPNAWGGMPWKFFESLACGVPVIVEKDTLRAQLVKELGCGLALENDDPAYIAEVIAALAANPDQLHAMCVAASKAGTLRFNWESMSRKLIEVYGRLAG